MTSYTLRKASPARTRTDAVVVGVVQDQHRGESAPVLHPAAEEVAKAYGRRLRPLLSTLGVTGKAGEAVTVPADGTLNAHRLVLVGLGPADGVDAETVRRAAGVAARTVANASSVALALPADSATLVAAATEGFWLGGYAFTRYRSTPPQDDSPGQVVVLSPLARTKAAAAALERAQVVASAASAARDWVNVPGGDLTPPVFADEVAAQARELGKGRGAPPLRCRVRDEQELAELGCGGILGVGQGSAAPPRLVELQYAPRKPVAHLALIGKGITYDSGGLTLKPGQSMATMKCDMAGAATVLQATFAIARLGLPLRVSTFAPMAENMVSGSALRPGDVLTMYGGTTVEISNTDAEGRLVLADALGRAAEQEPDVMVDVATLTGHMQLALGDRVSGALGSEDVVAALGEAGASAGETHWPMPLPDDVVERMRDSRIADLRQHDWIRPGGGLFAAAFLREFTRSRPWGHLDIAGPGFHDAGASDYRTPGGTAFGLATLVGYAERLAGVGGPEGSSR